ncbi:MAG: electron transporter RnfC, partial [Planctomycetota bacterium]
MKIDTKGKFSFPGGVHPPESKDLTCASEIQPGPAVKQVAIMLSQHIGAPCRPTVEKKQAVSAGQKIGDADAFVSAPV